METENNKQPNGMKGQERNDRPRIGRPEGGNPQADGKEHRAEKGADHRDNAAKNGNRERGNGENGNLNAHKKKHHRPHHGPRPYDGTPGAENTAEGRNGGDGSQKEANKNRQTEPQNKPNKEHHAAQNPNPDSEKRNDRNGNGNGGHGRRGHGRNRGGNRDNRDNRDNHENNENRNQQADQSNESERKPNQSKNQGQNASQNQNRGAGDVSGRENGARPQSTKSSYRAPVLSDDLDLFGTSASEQSSFSGLSELVDESPVDPADLPDSILDAPAMTAATDTKSAGDTEIVGVRFLSSGKTYSFSPAGKKFKLMDPVIVETSRGLEYAEIAQTNRFVPHDTIVEPLRSVVRAATPQDTLHNEENGRKEEEAFRICNEQIVSHGLEMKLIDARYTFDNTKLLFYFTSAGRVDFRALVKDLASIFHTRIELRQIGIRDEAKMIGGYGMCGRSLCCSVYLTEFGQVSIKMAKEQNLSLNSAKISGACGRLMCCLRYEHETYQEEISRTPPVGSTVRTENGTGTVVDINPLAGIVKVRMDANPQEPPVVLSREKVTVLSAPAENGRESSSDERSERYSRNDRGERGERNGRNGSNANGTEKK